MLIEFTPKVKLRKEEGEYYCHYSCPFLSADDSKGVGDCKLYSVGLSPENDWNKSVANWYACEMCIDSYLYGSNE